MSDTFRVKIPCHKGSYSVEIIHCSGTLERATILNVIAYNNDFQYGDIVALEKTFGGFYSIKNIVEPGNFFLYEAYGPGMTQKYFNDLLVDLKTRDLKDHSSKVHIENWSLTIDKSCEKSRMGIVLIAEEDILWKMADFIKRRKLLSPNLLRDSGDELGYRRHLLLLE